MAAKKEFVKITFEDLEIAENFFENDRHFAEWVSAVIAYYRGKKFSIKTKIVRKYFETYKKTMDFILDAKKNGEKGGLKRVENQSHTTQTLQGPHQGGHQGTLQQNNKLVTSNHKLVTSNHKLVTSNHKLVTSNHKKESKIYSNEVREICNFAYQHFSENLKPKTEKKMEVWLDTVDKLIRIDGKPLDEIKRVIKWARTDDFTAQNFCGLKKLRQNDKKNDARYYDVYLEKMNKSIEKNGKKNGEKNGRTFSPITDGGWEG